jgi:thioredoxin reductase/Pyruvate/2-oxoacid:ferredoxin oxidoreductase delta subunit
MDILNINETLATIILAAIIIFAVLIPYYLNKQKNARKISAQIEEAKKTGKSTPFSRHPQFNVNACIGIGICTRVCPEGDVLGLVKGKVAIVKGASCIGIGECARECPVGAISIGMGDISTREDIPQLSENLETNIPGIYIAGELGGISLVKNAIAQGKEAVDAIFTQSQENTHVMIVGSGPAGMSAALRCVEKKISYTIIDQTSAGGTILQYPRKKMTLVQNVELPLYGVLDKGIYSKEELLEIWKKVQKQFSIEVKESLKLQSIEIQENGFISKTIKGEFESTHVILALGRRGTPRKLGVQGEEKSKVSYKLIDASSYQDKNILIVGGGDSAVEAAIGMAHQYGNKVIMSYRKENFFRLKSRNETQIEEMMNKGHVKVHFSSNLMNIEDDSVILKQDQNEIKMDNDYVFIFAGGIPPYALLKDVGIKFGSKVENKV